MFMKSTRFVYEVRRIFIDSTACQRNLNDSLQNPIDFIRINRIYIESVRISRNLFDLYWNHLDFHGVRSFCYEIITIVIESIIVFYEIEWI